MFRIAIVGIMAVAAAASAQNAGVIVDRDTGDVFPVDGVKDLAAVEPRIPLTPPDPNDPLPAVPGALMVINTPGSYFLTSNLNGGSGFSGIDIQTSNVTLDLSGYSMVGLSGSVHAITSSTGAVNVRILNGTIRGWDGNGIDAKKINQAQIENVLVANCDGNGIEISRGVVKCCQVRLCLGSGIRVLTGMGMVKDCRVEECGLQGIDCGEQSVVTGCSSTGNGKHGFRVGRGSTVEDCTGSQNTLDGIVTLNHGTIRGCAAFNNGSDGIRCGNNSSVSGCEANLNVENGIVTGTSCSISNCVANLNTLDGISADDGASISGCSASQNSQVGIDPNSGSRVADCSVYSNSGNGIQAQENCCIIGCDAQTNGGDGITAVDDTLIFNNSCQSNTGAGISVTNTDCRVDSNHVADDEILIDTGASNCVVIRNTCRTITDNGTSTHLGGFSSDPATAGPWDNLDM